MYNKTMEKVYDFAIFGGGVGGACLLNKLTRLDKSAVILEKAQDVATGQTKANSGIIHAGFDAKPNTLKAKLNVRGSQIYPSLCKEIGVELIKCGAVVVDKTPDVPQMLYERGLKNQVDGLEILNQEQLHSLVKNLKSDFKYGLYAKSSAVISPFMFTVALCEHSVINGGEIVFDFDAENISFENDIYKISSQTNKTIYAKNIINCAGFGYNDIAKLLGEEVLQITFKRGEYFVLDNTENDFVSLTVFPAPNDNGKGILATPTADGNILLGPNAQVCDYDLQTTTQGLMQVKQGVENMFNNLPWKKVIRNYSGVRTIYGDDFYIKKGKNKNIVNIAGICSPGLSSAPAIAEYVCFEILKLDKTEKQMKPRDFYINMNKLSLEQQNEIIKKDGRFGKIVCKCEKVSEGEILQAINSPLKPKSIDGIKRRVRAGMGRCQGGFCTLKVANLIARQNNIELEQVLKENKQSEIALESFKNGIL